jgi:hypothetical protein
MGEHPRLGNPALRMVAEDSDIAPRMTTHPQA